MCPSSSSLSLSSSSYHSSSLSPYPWSSNPSPSYALHHINSHPVPSHHIPPRLIPSHRIPVHHISPRPIPSHLAPPHSSPPHLFPPHPILPHPTPPRYIRPHPIPPHPPETTGNSPGHVQVQGGHGPSCAPQGAAPRAPEDTFAQRRHNPLTDRAPQEVPPPPGKISITRQLAAWAPRPAQPASINRA